MGDKRKQFLLNIDSNTVVDQQKISLEMQYQNVENYVKEPLSLINTLNIRINVLSSIFDPKLLVRIPTPALSIDLTLPSKVSTTNDVNVKLRKTVHGSENVKHVLLMEQMVQRLSNDCLVQTKRVTRSRLRKCWHEENAISKKLVNVDQRSEKLQQSDILLNPPKYYGLFTENQIKLFEHVLNIHKRQLSKFVDRTGLIQKLSNINMISNSVTLGIIYKNIAADLYNGDYVGAASGAASLGGNYVISKGFTLLAERKYLQNSKTLGFISPVLKRSAPFVRRFAAGYNLYSLYKSFSSYSKNGDTPSMINLIESSTFVAVDVAEIGMELAGAETLLSLFGPIGAAVTAVVFIGSEIYQVHERLKPYNKILHLSMIDKVVDGAYTFFTGQVDSIVKDAANEKQMNEYLAISATEYLKNRTEIFAYIFPIYISIDGKKLLADNNVIKLDKWVNINWPNILLDYRKMSLGTEILCFTSDETEWSHHSNDTTLFEKFEYHFVSFLESMAYKFKIRHVSYRCDNALGLRNRNVIDGKILIDLQDGDDIVDGFDHNEHVFVIGDGRKTINSRSKDLSTFLFIGNLTTGSICSPNNGSSVADFTNYARNLTEALQIKMHNRRTIIETQNNSQLSMENVFNILGRKDKPDYVIASCFMKSFNSNGAGKKDIDILIIPYQLCIYNLTILAGDSTEIHNRAIAGSFKYSLTIDVGNVLINTTNSSLAIHEIFFRNWNITGLDRLFFEKDCIFFVYWTAYSKICRGNSDQFTFRFSDGFSMKIGRDRILQAYGSVTNLSDFQISAFHDVSQKLEVIFNIKSLDTKSRILISHGTRTKQTTHIPVVLPNDPNNKRSILIGGALENIFVINPTMNSSVTEIIISILNEHSFHNTVDFSYFAKHSIHYTVEMIGEDLVLTIIHAITNSSQITVSLRIKKCFQNALYKTFTIIVNSPMLIEIKAADYVYLKPRPLIIDPSKNPATIIDKNQIEPSLEIQLDCEVQAWDIYRANRNLIWFAHGSSVEFFWIILQDFYTINDQSLIDMRIKFDHNNVEFDELELSWNNTRPEAVQDLESILEAFANNTIIM